MNSIKIEIPSLSENIRIIESFIDNAKEQYLIDDDIYGNIMIAVTESVNNAIKHGNSCETGKNVFLSLNLYDHMIKFVIEDQGQGFDFQNLPDPTAPDEALSSTPTPAGRGLDADTPEAPEVERIELSLDETEIAVDESLGVDFADALTPTSSDSLPSPELSLADDDQEPDLTEDAAMPTDSPPPTAVETPHPLEGDQPQESGEYRYRSLIFNRG